jgi:hypothetical protein
MKPKTEQVKRSRKPVSKRVVRNTGTTTRHAQSKGSVTKGEKSC